MPYNEAIISTFNMICRKTVSPSCIVMHQTEKKTALFINDIIDTFLNAHTNLHTNMLEHDTENIKVCNCM